MKSFALFALIAAVATADGHPEDWDMDMDMAMDGSAMTNGDHMDHDGMEHMDHDGMEHMDHEGMDHDGMGHGGHHDGMHHDDGEIDDLGDVFEYMFGMDSAATVATTMTAFAVSTAILM